MLRRMVGTAGALIAFAIFAGCGRASAQSFGLLHMPTTVPQYLGWGYGAGHQAPIVRTPGYRPDRMQRMAFAPRCTGPLCPAPYEPIGCYGGMCSGCATSPPTAAALMPPQIPMASLPTRGPSEAPPHAPFFPGANGPVLAQPAPSYVWR
jgi:hypothetical protein